MSRQQTPSGLAGGTIRPFRFVKQSTTEDSTLLEANSGEFAIGVTEGSSLEFDVDNHATDGDPVYLQPDKVIRVSCGGTVTRGETVMSDANGQAVTLTAGSYNFAMGKALMSGLSGGVIDVWFHPMVIT